MTPTMTVPSSIGAALRRERRTNGIGTNLELSERTGLDLTDVSIVILGQGTQRQAAKVAVAAGLRTDHFPSSMAHTLVPLWEQARVDLAEIA